MNISASELVKCSASQLLYKYLRSIQDKPTERKLSGNNYANEIVEKEGGSSEKRGILEVDGDLIFFCIDMVIGDRFIEIKMVDNEDDYADWYLESSIMQSILYCF
jgi:hypothetical protein